MPSLAKTSQKQTLTWSIFSYKDNALENEFDYFVFPLIGVMVLCCKEMFM